MLQPGCLYETSKSRLGQLQPPAARKGQPGPCKHGSTAQRNGPQFGCSRKLSYFRHDSQEFRGRIARCTTCFTEIFVAKKRRGSVHCGNSQLADLLEKKSRNGNAAATNHKSQATPSEDRQQTTTPGANRHTGCASLGARPVQFTPNLN